MMRMMDECTDILTPSDVSSSVTKIPNSSALSFSNVIYLSGNKNPFDQEFKLALENRLNSNSSTSSSSLTLSTYACSNLFNRLNSSNNDNNSNSPLNTPLIPLTDFNGAPSSSVAVSSAVSSSHLTDVGLCDPSPAITTAQITNLIIESESSTVLTAKAITETNKVDDIYSNDTVERSNSRAEINQKSINVDKCSLVEIRQHASSIKKNDCATSAIDDGGDFEQNTTISKTGQVIDFVSNKKNIETQLSLRQPQQRSNVVSVICPLPTIKPNIDHRPVIRSAPVILEATQSIVENDQNETKTKSLKLLNNKNLRTDTFIQDFEPELALKSNMIVESNREIPSCLVTSSSLHDYHHQSAIATTTKIQPLSKNFIPIQPKLTSDSIDLASDTVSESLVQSVLQSTISSALSLTKRKEKTFDELLSKIKATEAALPPKAKPGRKRKSSIGDDTRERKRLSLERNRAAAMRCRLKKKKEIDELKKKVQNYERQNNELKGIIDSLCKEVAYLKNELLRHKDCN